jgi:polyisoprenoid-binding protein YceI
VKKVEAPPAMPPRARLGLAQLIVALAGALYVFTGAALLFAPLWFYQTIGDFGVFNQHYEGDSRRISMIWEIDHAHSQVSFAIRVMSLATTRGRFNRLHGHLHIDEQTPANSWVEAEVDAASINTHNLLRDTHLRSGAFFTVKKYPTIACKSTRVEHIGGSAYTVTGNLTLLGTTKPITFAVSYSGQRAG